MRKACCSILAAAVGLFVTTEASAAFHVMKVVEVYAGSAAAPNASYVQLQMYAGGQNFVAGHSILVYDATGVEIGSLKATFPAAVAVGADQSTILVGTAGVQSAFGVTPDLVLSGNLNQAGGKVCFDAIDCFAWGNYTGDATGVGTPFAALTTGKAAKRTITGGTNAAGLDEGDDTGVSSADFTAVDPAPKNNAGAIGGLDGGTPAPDSGTSSSGGTDSGTPTGKDSGVSTKPNPDAATGTASSSTSSGGAAPAEDEGCNASGTSPADISLGGLGLTLAAAMTVLSRLRRKRR